MKIAVLVSGGVDSSVALALLKKQGLDVTAFYIKIWLEDELSFLGTCPWQEDLEYVQAVCQKLEVPLEVISLQKEYWDEVVRYTIDQARAGKTPNPDIVCNTRIKFGAFLKHIDNRFDKVATGHYAQIVPEKDGPMKLVMSPDAIKDQTYFLSGLTQAQLTRALFPIGHLTKAQVRELAHAYDLPTKVRKDSQGICFLGTFAFDEFLKFHLGQKPGALIEMETNKQVGTHRGYWFYTIGQRQGLGLAGGPWYVVSKDIARNYVYISRHYYDEDKHRNTVIINNVHWIASRIPDNNTLSVKLRHGKHMTPCVMEPRSDGSVRLQLAERDQGIASGQFAVLYDGSVCLGSGVIQ